MSIQLVVRFWGIGIFLLALLVLLISTGASRPIDLPLIHFIQSFENPFLTKLFTTFTAIGSWYWITPLTCLLFVYWFTKREKRRAGFSVFVVVGTVLLTSGFKKIIERPRPEIHRLMEIGGYSFPSGHTMMAVSLYGALVITCWQRTSNRGRTFLLLLAGSMISGIAISRIYVGVHYPTDIVGGVLTSSLWLVFSYWLFFGQNQKV